MENSPRIVVIPTNLIILTLFILLLTQTNAQTYPKSKPSQKPIPSPRNAPTQSPQPPNHSPTNSHKNPKPESPSPSPNNPNRESPEIPQPKPKSGNSTSPYHFANNFCLSRRLDVQSTFCLKVLRSSPTSTEAQSNKDLLQIAAYSAIDFGNRTTLLLKRLSKDKTAPANLMPVVDECLSAYNGYIAEYNMLVQEAQSRAELASFDAELAKNEINRCVNSLTNEFKNAAIESQNGIALDYTKLTQNIADSISTN